MSRTSSRNASAERRNAGSLHRDARRLYEAAAAFVRLHQFRDRDRICCRDVSVTQCWALEALLRSGGRLPQTAVASALRIDKSTASRVLDALEAKGHVRRRKDMADRRVVRVSITDAGRRLHGAIEADLVAAHRGVLAGTTAAFRRRAIDLFDGLVAMTAARIGREGAGDCGCHEPARMTEDLP